MHINASRARKRTITSCLECYRRKQKCDRKRPCNFCTLRSVPEICRYESSAQHAAQTVDSLQKDPLYCTNSERSHTASTQLSAPNLLDQIGYASALQRSDLETVGECITEETSRNVVGDQHAIGDSMASYLDILAALPPGPVVNGLVNAYFEAETWSFPVLEEQVFRKMYEQFKHSPVLKSTSGKAASLPPDLATFPALLFMVLASALWFITVDTEEAHALNLTNSQLCDHASQHYLHKGQEVIDRFKDQKPTVTSIEFHLVKMSWHKNCGRGSTAWQSLCTALREAQELNLHHISEPTLSEPGASVETLLSRFWDIEHRKRLWAKLFIMDSHMAMALGRPRGINREDCSTSPPLDCDYPAKPSQTLPGSTTHTTQPPSVFSHVTFSIALGHKYHDLMSMRARKLDLKDFVQVDELHNSVKSLLVDLPPALRAFHPDTTWDSQKPQLPAIRLRLLTTANIFLLALHRPYVSTHSSSRSAAVEAALTMLQAQQDLFALIPQAQHKLYGYSFYTINAGIFITTSFLKYRMSDMSYATVLSALHQAILRLGLMKQRSHIARKGEEVLRRCYDILGANGPFPPTIQSYPDIDTVPSVSEEESMGYLKNWRGHSSRKASCELSSLLTARDTSVNSSTADKSAFVGFDYSGIDGSLDALLATEDFSDTHLFGRD